MIFKRYKTMDEGLQCGMRRPAWFFVLLMVTSLLVSTVSFVPTYAQLQQSGGGGANSSVGSRAAAAPGSATMAGGIFNTTLPTVASGNMEGIQIDSSGRLLVAQPTASALNATVTLGAGTAAAGTVRTNPLTSCGNTIFDSAITTLPTVEAAATATATCVEVIYCNNLTAASQVFSIKDNAATPIVIVNGFNLPANSNILLTFGGIKFNLGVRWVATNATAVNCQILGYQ